MANANGMALLFALATLATQPTAEASILHNHFDVFMNKHSERDAAPFVFANNNTYKMIIYKYGRICSLHLSLSHTYQPADSRTNLARVFFLINLLTLFFDTYLEHLLVSTVGLQSEKDTVLLLIYYSFVLIVEVECI